MTRMVLPCLIAITTFSYLVSSAPYESYDYKDESYGDYGYGSYSSHKKIVSSTPSYYGSYDSIKSTGYYQSTSRSYDRYSQPKYKYDYRDYDYREALSPPEVEHRIWFLPRPVTDWFEKVFNKVGDVVSEIAQRKEKIVSDFVADTMRKGEKVANTLYDDVMNRTSDKQHDLMGTIADFERKLFAIPTSVRKIWERDEPMTAAESTENKETLVDIKNKLDAFEKKVEEEIENEKDLPFALRNQLLKFVTASRGIVKGMGSEEETFWKKINLLEKEMYKFQLTVAETSDDLKGKMDTLFNALKKVDLPKLKSVKKGEKKLDEVDRFFNKILTE